MIHKKSTAEISSYMRFKLQLLIKTLKEVVTF